jgi:RimJ/RimL family protein N-acetyltransferase
MPQPVLRTTRLTLVPLAEEHLEFEVELDADPEVMRYLTPRPRTRAEVVEFHRRRLDLADGRPGLGFWVGLLDDEPVGWWLLDVPDDGPPDPGQAELGYRLHRRYWRRGLAGEGSRELLRHAFADLGLRRVIARTMAVNAGSRATMTSVGMTHVRDFHADFDEPVAGAEHGEVEYAITREQWSDGQRSDDQRSGGQRS